MLTHVLRDVKQVRSVFERRNRGQKETGGQPLQRIAARGRVACILYTEEMKS
jgi:hypothetical protein